MTAIEIILYIGGGGILLYYGGDFLVKGASRLARSAGIAPFVIGLTIVAFSTSLPELVVSLFAAIGGNEGIALGNIIGSNIANIGLIIGLSATIFHLSIVGSKFKKDLNILLLLSLMFSVIMLGGQISKWEGAFLFSILILYTFYSLINSRKGHSNNKSGKPSGSNFLFIILGAAALCFGANFFVKGAAELARMLNVSELSIGLTVAAYGTSLPELATSLVAAYRKESEISVGNIIGSNIFNMLCVAGIVSMVKPLPVDIILFKVEIPIMLLYVLALYPISRLNGAIPKVYSLFLLLSYFGFIIYVF